MSEASLAEQLDRDGLGVRVSHGRHWRRLKPGFYGPMHWLARLTLEEAQRPGACWGFVAGLEDHLADQANGSIPIHVIPDLAGYGLRDLPKTTRRAWRRLGEQGIRIVHVNDERVFHHRGYEVMHEWRGRKGLPVPTRDKYLAQAETRLASDAWLALAALEGDTLLGYAWAWAIDHAAYLHEYAVLTSAMSAGLRLSALLNFAAVTVIQRTESVKEMSAGLVQTEDAGALAYKLEQGYPVKHIPARVLFPWPVARILRATRPGAYHRLTGVDPRTETEQR